MELWRFDPISRPSSFLFDSWRRGTGEQRECTAKQLSLQAKQSGKFREFFERISRLQHGGERSSPEQVM